MGQADLSLPAFLRWALSSALLLVPASFLGRHLAPRGRTLGALTLLLLWVHLVMFSVLCLGLLGHLRPGPLLLASVGAAALAVVGWRVWPPPPRVREADDASPTPTLLAAVLIGLLALQAARLAAHVWLLPPYVFDVLTYHMPNVAEWVSTGAIGVPSTVVNRGAWPAGFELLEAWFAVFPHHDAFVELAGIVFYAIATGSVYSIARSLALPRAAAALAAAAYACTPAVAIHASSCKNHLPLAALYLYVAALMAAASRGALREARTWLPVALAFFLGLSIKPVAALVPGLAVLAWAAHRSRGGDQAALPAVPLPVVAFVVASGLTVAGYWYARNALLYGNPLYPTDVVAFGHVVWGDGLGIKVGGFSVRSLALNLRSLVLWRALDTRGPYNTDLNDIAGWGWFAMSCGLPALAWALVRVPRFRPVALAFGLSFLSLMAWITTDLFNMRHALWFPAVFALAFAAVVPQMRPAPRTVLCALAAAATGLNLVGTLDAGRISPSDWARMWRLPLRERSTAALGLYMGPGYQGALDAAGRAEPLGYHVHANGWIYPLYGPDFSRRLRFVPLGPGRDPVADMRLLGVKWLFAPKRATGRRAFQEAEAAVQRGGLVRAGEDLYVLAR